MLTVSPPASLVSTQRPPSLPPSSASPPSTQRSERLYPNKDRRPGDACMGGVGGGWVGWLVGEPRGIGGVYAREEEGPALKEETCSKKAEQLSYRYCTSFSFISLVERQS